MDNRLVVKRKPRVKDRIGGPWIWLLKGSIRGSSGDEMFCVLTLSMATYLLSCYTVVFCLFIVSLFLTVPKWKEANICELANG